MSNGRCSGGGFGLKRRGLDNESFWEGFLMLLEELLTEAQVLERYGHLLGTRSKKTLWSWRKQGRLGFLRRGKVLLYLPEHIENFLADELARKERKGGWRR